MSFPEVLDAVKALDRDEKVQLMQSLREEIGDSTDEELIAKHFPPARHSKCGPLSTVMRGLPCFFSFWSKKRENSANE